MVENIFRDRCRLNISFTLPFRTQISRPLALHEFDSVLGTHSSRIHAIRCCQIKEVPNVIRAFRYSPDLVFHVSENVS